MTGDAELARFLIERVPAFGRLPASRLPALTERAVRRVAAPGEVVVQQGRPADGLFVVHSGLLEVAAEDADGRCSRLGWRTRDELIGATSVLAGRDAAATITARRHAWLLAFDPIASQQLLLEDPAVMASLATHRLGERLRRTRPGASVYAVVAMELVPDVERIEAGFEEACRRRAATSFVSERQAREAVGELRENGHVPPALAAWLHDRESDVDVALSFAREPEGAWFETCAARADSLFVLVPPAPTPELVRRVRALLEANRGGEVVTVSPTDPELALEAWSRAVPDRNAVVIAGSDVDEIVTGLDNVHAYQGNPERLRRFAALADVPAHDLELIHENVRWMFVPGGEPLFREGDADDAVYWIDAGAFRLTRALREGEEVVAEAGPGETIGDPSVLAEVPRDVTALALRDGFVARIPGAEFRELCRRVPALAEGTSRTLAMRLGAPEPLDPRRAPRNLAVVPLTDGPGASGFGRAFGETLAALGVDTRVLDPAAVDGRLGAGASEILINTPRAGPLEEWLASLEDSGGINLYVAGDRASVWTQRCLRQADAVVLVADAGEDPELRDVERPFFVGETSGRSRHLVLIQPPDVVEARETARWLEPRPGVIHHHVRVDHPGDRARTARRVLKRAVGIAFSGASSRGVAHLGVARGLADLGLPLDAVTGSSSGAAVAGLLTLGLSHEEMMERAVRFLTRAGMRTSRLQPPLASLMSGQAFGAYLRETFGERRLEDQLVPCTLTGVDLNRHQLVRMRSGPLWLAARASMSLPLFWPPVWFDDYLMVDGGIMSYMPIEEILDECAGGLAIASDLDLNAGQDKPSFEGYHHYGATLSGWSLLARRLARSGDERRYPNIADVLFHSMCIPSFEHQKRIRHLTAQPTVRFVRPPVEADGFFTVDAETSRRFEQLAYETALRELKGVTVLDLESRGRTRAG